MITHTNIKTLFRDFDAYYEPLSKKWINRKSRNHVSYTIVLSTVKLPTKLQYPIL